MLPRTRRLAPYAALLAAVAVLLVVRVLMLGWWVSADEAGYLLLAQGLGEGDELYGRYWVDRPPTLIWIFALGDLLGGIVGVRILAALGLVGFLVLLHRAARLSGGAPGWALLVAVPVLLAPAFAGQVANGEALAIPFVAASVVAALSARRHPGGGLAWVFVAGSTCSPMRSCSAWCRCWCCWSPWRCRHDCAAGPRPGRSARC